jgi:superfamily II DNA helicase RecQ
LALLTPRTFWQHQKGVLDTVLLFNKKHTVVVNLGNDRPNIELSLEVMAGSKKKHSDLDFIREELKSGGRLRQRMIFVETCNGTEEICRYVRALVSPNQTKEIAYYRAQHAYESITKDLLMERFRDGKINTFVTTEAAGMVEDLEIRYGRAHRTEEELKSSRTRE